MDLKKLTKEELLKKNLEGENAVFQIQSIEDAKYLKEQGVSLSETNNKDQFVLTKLILEDNVELVDWLLENVKQIDVNYEDVYGKTSIFYVQSAEMVNVLVKHYVDLNYSDLDGRNALHNTWEEDKTEVVEALIKAGTDVNAGDFLNQTPLFYQRNLPVIEQMYKLGANLKHTNKFGTGLGFEWYKEGYKPLAKWFKYTNNPELLKEKDGMTLEEIMYS